MYKKNLKEIVYYLIFGVLTTIVNISSFIVLNRVNVNYIVSNLIAWFLSVLFAFYTNNNYVFIKEGTKEFTNRKLLNFYISRGVSLIVDLILIYIFVSVIELPLTVSKIIVNIIIILINYIMSKVFIFN